MQAHSLSPGPSFGVTAQELWPPTRTATFCHRSRLVLAKSPFDAGIGFVPSEAPYPARSLGACMGARRSTRFPSVATPLREKSGAWSHGVRKPHSPSSPLDSDRGASRFAANQECPHLSQRDGASLLDGLVDRHQEFHVRH